MNHVRCSAPGKLVLCGEYVVLDGAPAIGVAVNRRSSVSLRRATGQQSSFTCPGFLSGRSVMTVTATGAPIWADGKAPGILGSLGDWLGKLHPVEAVLDTAAFADSESRLKYGIGSSASLAVSLSASVRQLLDLPNDALRAADLHRRFQGGAGSGIDIATCSSGGVIEYRMNGPEGTRQLAWPDSLLYQVFWTGRSSSTTDKIGRYKSASDAKGVQTQLADAARDVIDAWQESDKLPGAFSQYAAALKSFDEHMALGIYDGGHRSLDALADRYPLVYKPCGAGGGDIGIALSSDADALDAFSARAGATGAAPVDLSIDNDGLLVEECSA